MRVKNRLSYTASTFLLCVGLLLGVSQSAQASTGVNVATHTQREIVEYLNNSGATINDPVTYSTTPSATQPYALGALSLRTQNMGVAMINQIRYIAGLGEVTLDFATIQQSQAAALVQAANAGGLNHSPIRPSGMSDELYELGATGSSRSNLSAGRNTLNKSILEGWTGDYSGSNLTSVGHRRWVLNPTMTKTSFGVCSNTKSAYNTYYSMYAFDRSGSSKASGVAWPAQQMPLDYFGTDYPWSFSYGQSISNTSGVAVTLVKRSTGQTWKFSESYADGHFAINNQWFATPGCIIFRPNGVTYADGDVFDVTIKGLPTAVEYSVTFFDRTKVALYEEIIITKQPTNVTAKQGELAKFTVEAIGEGLTYQWQYKNTGFDTWYNSKVSAAKTNKMSFSVGTEKTLNGRQYRCVITDSTGKSIISNVATLTVQAVLAITTQPMDSSAAVGEQVTFSVKATGIGLTYQWQFQNVGSTTWTNSGIKAAKTANLTFTVGTEKTLDGRKYRCVIKDADGTNTCITNSVTLTVLSGVKILTQPTDVTASVGKRVSFFVKAEGTGLSYQWQYQNAGATTWSNSSIKAAKTANMTFVVGTEKSLNGRRYQCVVTDKSGKKVVTNAVSLTVK